MARSKLRSIGRSIRDVKADLARLPVTVAHAAARDAAPELTRRARAAYESGQTVYGDRRPDGVKGPLSLKQTGDTFKYLRFVQDGTTIRCRLGTPYARYLIGKYRILPVGDRTAMPAQWSRALQLIVDEALARYVSQGRVAA